MWISKNNSIVYKSFIFLRKNSQELEFWPVYYYFGGPLMYCQKDCYNLDCPHLGSCFIEVPRTYVLLTWLWVSTQACVGLIILCPWGLAHSRCTGDAYWKTGGSRRRMEYESRKMGPAAASATPLRTGWSSRIDPKVCDPNSAMGSKSKVKDFECILFHFTAVLYNILLILVNPKHFLISHYTSK